MANRTYLIQSSSSIPTEDYDPDKDILVGASYMIPIFWYTLFKLTDIVEKKVEYEDGTAGIYPYLIVNKQQAQSTFASRGNGLYEIFSKSISQYYEEFKTLIEGIKKPYIHLETLELWMMDESAFNRELNLCLNAVDGFEHRKGIFTRLFSPKTDQNITILLKQADIETKNIQHDIEGYKFKGYGWVRAIPWKD